jgi:hypothetical protein
MSSRDIVILLSSVPDRRHPARALPDQDVTGRDPMGWRDLRETLPLRGSAVALLICSTIIVSWLITR